jgi:diguanylate cyclase (GGDEF)-like protein/PAS domain S-box-containing protein
MKPPSKLSQPSPSSTGKRTLQTAAITGCLMCVFELIKMAFSPHIGIWVSHSITILFVTVMAAISSFAVLKWNELLRLEKASSEDRYKLLFERSLAGAYRTSFDGSILDCNVSFCLMFGYTTREEVIGHSVRIGYLNPADRTQFLDKLRTEKIVTNFEQCFRGKDGRIVTVLNSATLLTRDDGSGGMIRGTLTDITDLRNAEQQNRRLAAIVRGSDDAILSLTIEGVIETWNRGAEQIYGYTAEEAIGKSIKILAPGDRSNETLQMLEEVARGDEVSQLETIRVTKDGRKITVALSISPLADAAGVVIGASTIARDITDKKRIEETLRKSEEQYRLLFNTNPIPMWVFDRATLRFLAVNQAAIRQYGFSEQEFLAMTIADIRPEEDVPDLLDHVGMHTQGLQESEAWRHRKKDGTIIDVEIACHDLDFQGSDAMLVAAYDVTDRKRSRELLQESENKYRALFEDSAEAYWLMDENRFLDCNAAALEMFGFSDKTEFNDPAGISPPCQADGTPSRLAAEQRIAASLQKGKETFEWLHRRKNDEVFPAEVCLTALTLGERPLIFATVRDITERKQVHEALLLKTALLEAQLETTIDGILAVDESDQILLANEQFRHYFDLPEKMLRAGDDGLVLEYVRDRVEHSEEFIKRVKYLYAHPDEKSQDEFRLKNGKTLDRYSAPLVDSNGQHRGRIWYFHDITDRKAAEERIQFLAFFDALTELPNRTLLHDRLSKALAAARRRNEQVAMLFLDIDHFKLVNDSLGHTVGDHLLKEFAARLKGCTREQDTVARVGGDEFVVALCGIKSQAEIVAAAKRVLDATAGRFMVDGNSLSASCSVGISIFPEHGKDCESLIQYADQAMYWAKEKGRNNYQFFKEEMNAHVVQQLTLENDLRMAIERKEFLLVYQPQVNTVSGKIVGLEALIRWKHPKLGFVPPDRFIPASEKNGLILPIGEWVLKTACSQARSWLEAGFQTVPVSVNVSAVQFRQEGFCQLIKGVLDETGLPPQYLELELTESLLMSNEDLMFPVLQELKEIGLNLVIDDFGTGYSSLSYLKQFPVNKLKIDRSFIRDLSIDPDDAAITSAIISMAKGLGLKVIAEGVETNEQMAFLRDHLCDEIQGYFFSKPITASEIAEKWLSSRSQQDMTQNRKTVLVGS